MSRPDLDAIVRDMTPIVRRLHISTLGNKRRRDDVIALETTLRILLRVASKVPAELLADARMAEEIQARLDGATVQMGLRG